MIIRMPQNELVKKRGSDCTQVYVHRVRQQHKLHTPGTSSRQTRTNAVDARSGQTGTHTGVYGCKCHSAAPRTTSHRYKLPQH
jgi:hypothetical protein